VSRTSFLIFGLLLFTLVPVGHAQFEELTLRLPNQSNMLILFDVEKIMASPIAQKEGWRENHENLASSGLLLIPPASTRFAMAASVDFEIGHSVWEAAVMDLQYEPSMPRVAAKYGGTVDEIAKLKAAMLPSDTCVVQFGKRIAGVMVPGNRQRVAQWVEQVYSANRVNPLSAYLREAENFAERNAQVIMALDLNHVYSRGAMRHAVGESAALKGKDVDLDALADVLASVKGITLGVSVKNNVTGAVKVDFEKDVSIMKDFAKELLLEALANHGAMINEFRDWKTTVTANRVMISGPLYQSGRQRIMSLVETPPGLQAKASASSEEGTEEQKKKLTALATQQYFNQLTQLVRDLLSQREGGQTSGQIGIWYQKYARRIDNLPILNVDKDLVDFGSHVSSQLRQSETAMKGIGARSAVRQSNLGNVSSVDYAYAGGGGYRYGRWGGWSGSGFAYGYRNDAQTALSLKGQERARIETQERIRGNTSANLIMQGVEAEFGEMRRHLTEKYDVEFKGL